MNGSLDVMGASITFNTPAQGWWPAGTQLWWTFEVTGNVNWDGGIFAPRVNDANGGISDTLQIDGQLVIGKDANGQDAKLTIAPVSYNLPNAGLPVTFQRTILEAKKGITVTNPATQIIVQSASPPYKATVAAPGGDERDINLIPG